MKIGEILIHQKSITQEELDLALWIQKRWGGLLGRILVSRGFLPESQLMDALSSQLGVPSVTLGDRCTPTGLCRLLPFESCVSHLFLAFGQDPDSGTYLIAMVDPRDTQALAALRSSLTRPFRVHLCGHLDLTEALYRLSLLLTEPASTRQIVTPVSRRATFEIIEADGLVEEIGIPERARAFYSSPLEAADDLEVLEESEMLAAMAAQFTGGRTSGELAVIVESGDFEIVSTDDLPPERSPTEPSVAGPSSTSPQETGTKAKAPPEDQATAPEPHPDKSAATQDKSATTPDKSATSQDKSAATQDKSAATDGPAKKSESGGGRRGLLAALAGGPREPEKKPADRKPPPSPFDARDKK